MTNDPFAAKRAAMREEFFGKLFLLGGWLGATDTYKRTMWAAVPDIAVARAGLHPDDAQGPARARRRQSTHHGRPRGDAGPVVPSPAAPQRHRAGPPLVQRALGRPRLPARCLGRGPRRADGRGRLSCRSTSGAFPAARRFCRGVPCLFFEGMGGAISYLEPAMCRYFAPIIQATKARLMKLATPRDAEFGLRAAPVEVSQPDPAAGPLRRRRRPAHLQRHGRVPVSGAVPLDRHHRP